MTPSEKAIELVNKFGNELNYAIDHRRVLNNNAKSCACLCCDEIIQQYQQTLKDKDLYAHSPSIELAVKDRIRYWEEVKTHIQSL